MRCAGCETELRSTARFCDRCGCQVAAPLTEDTPAPSRLHDWAPTPSALQDLRCPSCGGPSLDGDRCQACQQPAPLVERVEPAAPPIDTSTASAKPQPVAEGFWYASETSTAPSSGPSSVVAPEKTERLPARSRATTTTSVMDKVAGAAAIPAGPEAAKAEAMPPTRTNGDTVYAEKAPKPAVVDARKSVAVGTAAPTFSRPASRSRSDRCRARCRCVLASSTRGARDRSCGGAGDACRADASDGGRRRRGSSGPRTPCGDHDNGDPGSRAHAGAIAEGFSAEATQTNDTHDAGRRRRAGGCKGWWHSKLAARELGCPQDVRVRACDRAAGRRCRRARTNVWNARDADCPVLRNKGRQ